MPRKELTIYEEATRAALNYDKSQGFSGLEPGCVNISWTNTSIPILGITFFTSVICKGEIFAWVKFSLFLRLSKFQRK